MSPDKFEWPSDDWFRDRWLERSHPCDDVSHWFPELGSPTGWLPSAMQTFKPCPAASRMKPLEPVADGPHPLVNVDYSRIEGRVLALMGSHQSGKTVALVEMMRQRGYQVKLTQQDEVDEKVWSQIQQAAMDIRGSFQVPADLLGEDKRPLTGDELRAIMEGEPPWVEPKPARPGKNPFAQGSIRRYAK